MSRTSVVAVVLLCMAAGACASDSNDRDSSTPARSTTTGGGSTSTTTTIAPTTTTSTSEAAVVAPVRPAPAQPATTAGSAAPAFTCPEVPARRAPRADRPAYEWKLSVDLAGGVVTGDGTMSFTPDADIDRVVVRLWANSPRITRAGGRIDMVAFGLEQPEPTRVVLPRAAKAGERVTVDGAFRLTLPTSPTNDRVWRSGDAVRLGSFLPVIAWEPGVGWQEQPPTSGFAEASTSVPADFKVTVSGVPEGVSVLATGVRQGDSWLASGVPEWAMSLGRFTIESRDVDGIAVSVGVEASVQETPARYLDKVARSMQRFSVLYGPYPWPTYTLAITPALGGGIEYPMHVMQGPGTIGRTTSHEVAHMWFYGLVSTNQGRDPWIDEGLATWAEGRFEGTTGELMSRSIPDDGRGRAGEPMTYWESRQSSYYRSVYVQGAQAAGALAPASPDAVDCALRHLVARQAFEVTSPQELAAAIAPVFPNARDVFARFGIRA